MFEVFIVLALIAFNGFLALAELAIISARKPRLREKADKGDRGAALALRLASAPSDFLSAIQIGITLVGVLAGAYGGAALAGKIAPAIAQIPALTPFADELAFTLVVVVITYLTLIFGELVPKRMALVDPERFAHFVSRPVRWIAVLAMPLVRILSLSTEGVLRSLRIQAAASPEVTEEEVRVMIEKGAQEGVFAVQEESMIKRVLLLGDRKVGELMTPRPHMVTLDVEAPLKDNLETMIEAPHSYFPARRPGSEEFAGFVSSKCVLARVAGNRAMAGIEDCLTPPLYVTESMPALKLIDKLKESGQSRALVVDEHGATSGMITVADVLETVSGEIPGENPEEPDWIVRRDDGSWLVDGALPIYEMCERLGVSDPHQQIEGDYQTVAGMAMTTLGHIPKEGEHFRWQDLRFEVVDMDGNRIDKLLIIPETPEDPNSDQPERN